MGLDVSAYSKLERFEYQDEFDNREDDELPNGMTRLYPNDLFPQHGCGITDGCYEYGGFYGFYVGSYTAYSEWRDELALLAGYAAPKEALNQIIGELTAIRDERVTAHAKRSKHC